MPIVKFKIANNEFQISCEEGQEDKIVHLAKKIDKRFANLVENTKNPRFNLVLAALAISMEDEIETLNHRLNNDDSYIQEKVNEEIIKIINPVTNIIEKLANKLETA